MRVRYGEVFLVAMRIAGLCRASGGAKGWEGVGVSVLNPRAV